MWCRCEFSHCQGQTPSCPGSGVEPAVLQHAPGRMSPTGWEAGPATNGWRPAGCDSGPISSELCAQIAKLTWAPHGTWRACCLARTTRSPVQGVIPGRSVARSVHQVSTALPTAASSSKACNNCTPAGQRTCRTMGLHSTDQIDKSTRVSHYARCSRIPFIP